MSHIQNEILKQKKLTGSGFEGTPKLLKAFFSRLFFFVKTMRHSKFQLGQFFVYWFEIWQLGLGFRTKFKTMSAFL